MPLLAAKQTALTAEAIETNADALKALKAEVSPMTAEDLAKAAIKANDAGLDAINDSEHGVAPYTSAGVKGTFVFDRKGNTVIEDTASYVVTGDGLGVRR
jgi:hypothetical protein